MSFGNNIKNLGCCDNPCKVSQINTPTCESLPSQIQNFSDAFFGTVVKTEINGVITWSLPCGLNTGLPNNPRGSGEGLACYFLRLFEDGIIGLTGPKGDSGTAGTNGFNAYTVTLATFAQPTTAHPQVQVATSFNPAILPGMDVFIATSGWYLVDNTDASGALFLTLQKSVSGAPALIHAGKLVVPAGFAGASVQGPQGIQGPKGDQGPAGNTFTATNEFYFAPVGVDYTLGVTYTAVDFTNSAPNVTLPNVGTYLLTAVVDVAGKAGATLPAIISFKLVDTNITGDLPGSEHILSGVAASQHGQVVLNVIYHTSNNSTTVWLYGKATTGAAYVADFARTTITAVRLA